MKTINYTRLKALEDTKRFYRGVAIVEPVADGFRLMTDNKGTVCSLAELHKLYDVVIIDDVPRNGDAL